MSLPPEIRNTIYDLLWKAIGVIDANIYHMKLRVCYNCIDPVDSPHMVGLPTWLLTCRTIQHEALDQQRVNSMWALSLIRDETSRRSTALLNPDPRFAYLTTTPIKVFRMTYALVMTGVLPECHQNDYVWTCFMSLTRTLAVTAQMFQFGLSNIQDTFFCIEGTAARKPYWLACRQVCEEHVTRVGQEMIRAEGSLNVQVGEGLPPRSMLFIYTSAGRVH